MEVRKRASIGDGFAHAGTKHALLGLKLSGGITRTTKAGPCTPFPSWKLEDCANSEAVGEPKWSSVSARKLGATLWEIQDLLPDSMNGRKESKISRHRDRGKAIVDDGGGREDRPHNAGSLRRLAIASLIKHHKLNEANAQALQPVSPASYTSSVEIDALNQTVIPSSSKEPRETFGKVGYSLKTSTELLKVLNRIWSLEEQNVANKSLVKALKLELQHARERIQELMQEQHDYRHDIDALLKQVADDNMTRKNKEQQRIKSAVQSIRDELDDERRLRRRSENLHRKIGKELSEVKAAFLKAVKDLEGYRKANVVLENLCDQFAEGIQGYEQEVLELRQQTIGDCNNKIDRSMVHISEAWLDGRMQMKLAEARGDLPEKTSVTERLQTEIITFLQERRTGVSKIKCLSETELRRENILRRQSLESIHLNGATSAPQDAEDDDSVASDLHCFELSMGAANNEKQVGVNQNDGEEIEDLYSMRKENLDGARKAEFLGKKPNSVNEKDKRCSTSHPQHFAYGELTGIDSQHNETKLQQNSDSYHPQENEHDTKHQSRMQLHGTNCTSGQPAGSCSEITECGNGDNDALHMEISQLPTVGEDVPEFRHTTIPVQKCSIKENTLKAKLLEARIEGRHARLKSSKSLSVGARRH